MVNAIISRAAIVLAAVSVLGSACGPPPDCPTAPKGSDPWEELNASSPFADPAPPPSSIDELAGRMEIVVRGQYVGPDELRDAGQQLSPSALPLGRLDFEVSEYIVGAGPSEITVMEVLPSQSRVHVAVFPSFDEEFTLVAEPSSFPRAFAPALGPYGRLVEERGRVCYAFVDNEAFGINPHLDVAEVPFVGEMSMDELHEALRDAARERGLIVPGDGEQG